MSLVGNIASTIAAYALASGQNVMMSLGGFKFMISTAAYQELQRTTAYRWASQERFGKAPLYQYTGPGEDTINLNGVVYPEYKGGFTQVDSLRKLAAAGAPLLMTSGKGDIMGMWIILEIGETQSTFAMAGAPRKQDFTVQLKRFGDVSSVQN